MEVLTFNGQKYVKASKAARDLGYASDYVGQLCRKGAVDAHLVGRTWYVNPETLGAHRLEKKRNARVKAREHAHRSIEEAKSLRVKNDTKSYTNVAIRYESDSEELIPEVRKITINSYQRKVEPVAEAPSYKKYSIENENEKVVMSGTLKVRDAELEEEFTDTTVLIPHLIRTQRNREPKAGKYPLPRDYAIKPTDEPMQAPADHISFAERVTLHTVEENTEKAEESEENTQIDSEAATTKSAVLYRLYTSIAVMIVIVSIASLFVAVTFTYSGGVMHVSPLLDTATLIEFTKQSIDFSSRLFN